MTIITDQETIQARLQEGEGGAAGNLEKVRDLLFGGQMRDYERKFARLEDRLVKDTADLRDELKKRLAALESYMKAEVETLSERLRIEQDARLGGAKELARVVSDTAQQFEQKTSQLDDLIARTQRDLRQQLHAVQQELGDDIRQRVEDVLARLAQDTRELRGDKADRRTLATLLTDMAMRLTADGATAPESDTHG